MRIMFLNGVRSWIPPHVGTFFDRRTATVPPKTLPNRANTNKSGRGSVMREIDYIILWVLL